MVRGFGGVQPIWQLDLDRSPIQAQWGTGPRVDWSGPVGNMLQSFQQGVDWGDKKAAGKKVNELLQGVAGTPGGAAGQLLGMGAPGGPYGPQEGGTIASPGYNPGGRTPTFVAGHNGGAPARAPSGELSQLFADATQRYELPEGYLAGTAWIESKYNPQAKNPKSSAGGLFQQINSNWAEYGVPGTTRFDPAASTEAAAKFAAQNRQRLERALGRAPTAGELYLAHQQGPGGAVGLLSNPNAPAASVVGERAVRLNGGNPNMTAGEFAGLWTSKLDRGGPGPQSVAQAQAQNPATTGSTIRTTDMNGQPGAVHQVPAGPVTGPSAPAPQPELLNGTLAPKPQDRETAAAITQNQVQTVQAAQQQPRGTTFMGMPTQAPGGNVNPGAPVMGGQGQDQLLGGTGQAGAPTVAQPPAPPAGPAPQPPSQGAGPAPMQMRPAPAMPAPQPLQHRAPVAPLPRGTDPRLIQALGVAAQGGDSSMISAVQSAITAAKQQGRNISLQQTPNGGMVLVDQDTGEVSPYLQPDATTQKAPHVQDINGVDHQWVPGQGWVPLSGAQGRGAMDTILNPGDPRRAQAGIPDDGRSWRVTPKGTVEPIANEAARDDKTFTQEHQLYQDFENNPVVKEYRAMEQGVQGLAANFSEGNSTADTVAVIQLFKTIDPTSTVSASEVATQTNAGGVPEQLRALWNQARGQGGKFTPELRARIFNTAQRLIQQRGGQVRQFADSTRRRAQSYKLDPDRVVDWQPFKFERATPDLFPDRDQPPGGGDGEPAPLQLRVTPQRGAADAFDLQTNPPEIRTRRLD